MASQIGYLGEFDESKDEFQLYIERLEQYFVANQVDDVRRAAIFLSAVGAKTYKLLRNLLQPVIPKDISFDQMVKTLSEYYKPQCSIITERFRFHRRNQATGEDIPSYLVELKRLASTCAFEGFLDQALRDRLVLGLTNETIQKRLLTKRNISFTDASELATSMELAERNTSDMKNPDGPYVNALKKTTSYKKEKNVQPFILPEKGRRRQHIRCYRCGCEHFATECRHVNSICNYCSKKGHLAVVCRTKEGELPSAKQPQMRARILKQEEEDSMDVESLSLYSVCNNRRTVDYTINVSINNKPISMIVDSAADTTTISEEWYQENIPDAVVSAQGFKLSDYGEHSVEVLGVVGVHMKCEGVMRKINVTLIAGNKPALFGKDCIKLFKPNLHRVLLEQSHIYRVDTSEQTPSKSIPDSVEALIYQNREVFENAGKAINSFEASVVLKKDAKPIYRRARPVPFALKANVEEQIRQLVEQGIYKFVDTSAWATPLVLVLKKDNKVRICGDFKTTVNSLTEPEMYPLPTQKELFATLNNGFFFTKLDMQHAYHQIALDEQSKDCLTLNTHLGLLRPNRLLFGINTAAQIFQSVMDKVLSGLQGVICFQDDILVTSKTIPEHLKLLENLFKRLNVYGIQLNKSKCVFLQQQVMYLGHMIDHTGIHPTEQKVEAIAKMKTPENVHELQVFLGMLNYYIKFIKNAADLLHPLHRLLHKNEKWEWSSECEETFRNCKKILSSDMVLTHYDNDKELTLACDASPYGLGVVLSHTLKDEDRPIAYASRTLTKAEKSYSQIEREALSIIFGLKHFNQYLYGRHFTIITDHRPLLKLFGPHSEVPAMAAARIQRWALLLSSFRYEIKYKKGKEHTNADALSRFPSDHSPTIENEIYKLSYVHELPITSEDIRESTRKDAVLGRVLNKVKYGWGESSEEDLIPFATRRNELSIQDNCVLWGMRVVIPRKHRARLLELLHDTHPGITRMKSIARSHIWWPNIDKDIEDLSQQCHPCVQNQKLPPKNSLQSWIWPKSPWERVHIDYGQKGNQYFLIAVDAHSKWIEVLPTLNITTSTTARLLRNMFARYGLPREIVSDNGPQFTAAEFKHFLRINGIKHTLVPPYHPSSNGSAERSVQSFKSALAKMEMDNEDNSSLEQKIARYLLVQHNTPHTTTGLSPAKLFMGRELRDRWALLHMDLPTRVESSQFRQKMNHDRAHTSHSNFSLGDTVLARNGTNDPRWLQGIIKDRQSNTTWMLETEKGIRSFHSDQLKHKEVKQVDEDGVDVGSHNQKGKELVQDDKRRRDTLQVDGLHEPTFPRQEGGNNLQQSKAVEGNCKSERVPHVQDDEITQQRRNPPRNRKAPEKLNL